MGLITHIRSFFEKLFQTNKSNIQSSKEISYFQDIPINIVLTEELIDNTLDIDLVFLVFDNLSLKFPDDNMSEYDTVMTWNKQRQAIYMIWWFEGQVCNGGYNQFYFNSSGEFYVHLPYALHLIGADKIADLTQRANDLYESQFEQITKLHDGTIEGFINSYKDNLLNQIDTEFFELSTKEVLYDLMVAYVRKNKIHFIDK